MADLQHLVPSAWKEGLRSLEFLLSVIGTAQDGDQQEDIATIDASFRFEFLIELVPVHRSDFNDEFDRSCVTGFLRIFFLSSRKP